MIFVPSFPLHSEHSDAQLSSAVLQHLLLAKYRQMQECRFQVNTTFPNSFLCKVHVQTPAWAELFKQVDRNHLLSYYDD